MKNIEVQVLGSLSDGRVVTGYWLSNSFGMKVLISDFGGTIWQLHVPDRNGDLADVVCGYDNVSDLENSEGYLGALIGRFGNRIGGASFELDGQTYSLYANDHSNHLHGGKVGFDRRFWTVLPIDSEETHLPNSKM